MERMNISEKAKELIKRYKFVLLVLGIGIFLMTIPDNSSQDNTPEILTADTAPVDYSEKIEAILGQIAGVGKVNVLLTEAAGPETIYQVDEDCVTTADNESLRRETVIVTNSDREGVGLVRTVTPPVYLGAIIVCQGGDIPSVKLAIVQAVSSVTGISADRIAVLKMK